MSETHEQREERASEPAPYFQRYTHTTTMDGTRTGKARNRVSVLEPMGNGEYRVKVLMIAGVELPEPFITIGTLSSILRRW
jgi:hypothetical protein